MSTMQPTSDFLNSGHDKLKLAKMIARNPRPYGCPEFPDKPELSIDEWSLMVLHERLVEKKPVSAADKTVFRLFSNWRASVLALEQKAAGNVHLLLSSICAFQDVDKKRGPEVIRQFIQESYGKRLSGLICEGNIRHLSAWVAEQRELLPMYLRTMDKRDAPKEIKRESRAAGGILKKLTSEESYG